VGFADQLVAYAKEAHLELVATPELEEAITDFLRRARAPWPDIDISDETVLRHVGARMGATDDPVGKLNALHAADLYLACACSRAHVRAIAAFERLYVSQISAYLSRSDALPGFTDEVKQAVRERILVARDTLLPRIESYNGRGPLGGWLRMVTTRIAADLRRARRHDGRPIEIPPQVVSPDPEAAYLKQRYGPEFERAVENAFSLLETRGGNVLRLHFLDGLAPSAIAAMYRVSVRSVQRWIALAERDLLANTRRILAERLHLSPSELDSLLGLVRSQLTVTLHRS